MAMSTSFYTYDKLVTADDIKLRDIKLENLLTFDLDDRVLRVPKSIPYYREPTSNDYPIDLAKGWKDMYFSDSDPDHFLKEKTLHYIQTQEMLPAFDICTTRGVLKNIYNGSNRTLYAIKFNKCIYIKLESEQTVSECSLQRHSYPFKMRQCLYVDAPGYLPYIEQPVDQRKQVYAVFSANLGKLRLLYSAEMVGVYNKEVLGELNDPEVLEKIRFGMIKVREGKNRDGNQFNECKWLIQAKFAGIEHFQLAHLNSQGIVEDPIETISISDLLKKHERAFKIRIKLIHNFLVKIKEVMAHEDCPYTTYAFTLGKKNVHYKRFEGPNKHSFLDQEYINFIKNHLKP